MSSEKKYSGKVIAELYSKISPEPYQTEKFCDFLREKYGENIEFEWKKDENIENGFKLKVGCDVYDWTVPGRVEKLKEKISERIKETSKGNIIPLIRETVENFNPEVVPYETGIVKSIGDGIANVSGLTDAAYGEILIFSSGIKGMVQNLSADEIGCIIFGDDSDIMQGSPVFRTYKTAGVPVGDAFLSRIVNALGEPIDGKGDIASDEYRSIENPAPRIIDRESVNSPMETGILTIDSMFPIGKGQRELIIGDRQTGKTAIAVDAIINQKGKNVVCIYVAIGQKSSSVASVADTLKKHGAMEYTIIVNASAGESAPMQCIAPNAGSAMGEYFMDKGRDVLIVYDDLSKHAVAYRTLSLLLGRAPGREAYPGDIFYLHSRLLERSAHLSLEKGGGSMTALPIVETQNGDVSAYIPTNIISITDGQIFLETELFFSGQRPAVNVGLSVSRIGKDAQTDAMKKASGSVRLDLAQYREMKVFTQFASDLDKTAKDQLLYGESLMKMLCQKQNCPLKLYEQVILLVIGLNKRLQNIPLSEADEFKNSILSYFRENYYSICDKIETLKELSEEDKNFIIETADNYISGEWKK